MSAQRGTNGYALNLNGSGDVIGTDEGVVDADEPASLRTQITDALVASTITRRQVFAHGHSRADIISLHKTSAARQARILLWQTDQERSRAVPLPIRWLPQAVNKQGQMVGAYWLWQEGRAYNLNKLVARGSGWRIVKATAINNRGQIAGWGYHCGKPRAFLLTP